MDFEFSSDSMMLRDMVRRFVQKEARPLEMGYFTSGTLKEEERARLRSAVEQMGLWGLLVPERFGGGGVDAISACVVEMELGSTFIPVEIGNVPPAMYACSGDQVDRYLKPALSGECHVHIAAREPSGVTPESWTMVAMPNGDGYHLTGVKLLSRRPATRDVILTLARASEGWTGFLVDATEVESREVAGGGAAIQFVEMPIGHERVLGVVGGALQLGLDEAPRSWILTGAKYVGMTERLLEMGAEHARDWVALGAPLAVRPALRRVLAELRSELEAARWLVYHAAWCSDKGQPVKTEAAIVRLRTGELLKNAVDRVTMTFGGPGPTPQIEPQRMVHSLAPPEVLDFALAQARELVASDVLATAGGS